MTAVPEESKIPSAVIDAAERLLEAAESAWLDRDVPVLRRLALAKLLSAAQHYRETIKRELM